jgi:hypothetical protein
VGLLVALAGITPVSSQTAGEKCSPGSEAAMPPNAGPYMKNMNMREPMSGQMKRDDMMTGDVAKSAAQKWKCMSDVMKLDEKTMDARKK